ncbi:unnamed protein product [Mytilus edulis]|uniref:Reverse transcriptase domain-containing protein n=1 Tax=Mytilus edulis TaxID=6550 RepID=A0A8S3SAF8_MYTED|nr:unnamed protein product [Mytilus edulis]
MEALALLEGEDLQKTKIPIGQQKLLLKSIRQSFKAETENAPKSSNGGLPACPTTEDACAPEVTDIQDGGNNNKNNPTSGLTDTCVGNVLNQLQQQQSASGVINQGSACFNNIQSWQDPQIFIKSLGNNKTNSNYLDIVDFVMLSGVNIGDNDERIVSESGSGQLILKSGPTKPKLESLNVSQWSMANLAILYKLLEEGHLVQNNILDYLSYATRTYQLFLSHDVTSVFFYDREYRRLQNLHKFRWGTDVPHIQTVFLKSKGSNSNKFSKPPVSTSKGFKPFSSHTAGGKEICKKFNSRLGCSLSGCKFEHVCNVPGCGQRHSGSGHQSSFPKNEFGFDIVTSAANELPSGIVGKNHPSASPNNPLYEKAHLQILNEIERGNYVFAEKTPRIISPLAVIPKPDGGVRIIHDCSRPEGSAVNSFVGEIEKQRFQTLDEASKLVTPNCYMAKVDLKTAYRSVNLSSQSQEVTGLKWTFPDGTDYTFYDTKLPFGSKLAPHIFHRLSQAVRRMMSRRGFTIIAYLDDFLFVKQQSSVASKH